MNRTESADKEFDPAAELKKVPDQPGVYIMHDQSDAIIYVGKARSLTKRLHQYFQPSHDEGIKKKQMVANIAYFEYIVVDSELEALVLENNLIKENRPKYNTLLRDDKTYPYIKVTLEEPYPRVIFSRRMKRDRNRYFGPFPSAQDVKATVELCSKLFHLRTCAKKFPEQFGAERPCLNYHMKLCPGVCTGEISVESYRKNVDRAIAFLSGNTEEVTRELQEKMQAASDRMDFERAAGYRDLLESVAACAQRQKITSSDGIDRDIIGLAFDEEAAVIQVFFVRDGRIIGRDHFYMKINVQDEESSLTERFLLQYYSGTPFIPHEIFLPEDVPDAEAIEEWLKKRRGGRVYLRTPRIGQKEKLVELASKNAQMILSQNKEKIRREEGRTIGACKELSGLLSLPQIHRMEAYDISNISGYLSVGSMVVFENGKPKRSDYRKFRLKTVTGPDDYASMREVLRRRFLHGLAEKQEAREENSFSRFPDLIMMDGGRGQVNIALSVLQELGLSIPVCGMVKDDHHRTRGLYWQNEEIPMDKKSASFQMITRLQDEAHRFAIEYHRSLRTRGQVHSFLDDIPGIGPARRRALMTAFDSAEEMSRATEEQLAAVSGMNRAAAKALYDYFHNQKDEPPATLD